MSDISILKKIEEKQEILSKLGELYYELQGADEEEYEDLIREIFGDDADQVKVKTDEDGNLVRIPFRETEKYVKKVNDAIDVYKRLYYQ